MSTPFIYGTTKPRYQNMDCEGSTALMNIIRSPEVDHLEGLTLQREWENGELSDMKIENKVGGWCRDYTGLQSK